jgi:hypothetical protein
MSQNLSLYIKRAESNQTEEYIKNAFKIYGIIESVQFIAKSNDNGQKYNGVIVIFKQWNFNNIVEDLWKQLHAKSENIIKINHGPNNKKFWMVTEYKVPTENLKKTNIIDSISDIDLTNIDEKAIKIINDLQLKIKMLENQLEKKEQFCMQNEHDRMNSSIQATGAHHEVQDRDIQIHWLNEDIVSLKDKNSKLIKDKTKLMNDNLLLKGEIIILKEYIE